MRHPVDLVLLCFRQQTKRIEDEPMASLPLSHPNFVLLRQEVLGLLAPSGMQVDHGAPLQTPPCTRPKPF